MISCRAMRHVSPRVSFGGAATTTRTVRLDSNGSNQSCQETSLPNSSSLRLSNLQQRARIKRKELMVRLRSAYVLTRPAAFRRLYTTAQPDIASLNESQKHSNKAHADLPEQMRHIMRRLTNSVVVCTSSQGTTPRAMTMSSFTSLALSPTPLVTFNIATPSRTLDAIRSSRTFNIHILSGDIHGAKAADHFTKGNTESDIFKELQSAGLEHVIEPNAAPRLIGAGVLYILRCKIMEDVASYGLIAVRDHVIVLGEVEEMIPLGEENEGTYGLAYADRTYRRLGQGITAQ